MHGAVRRLVALCVVLSLSVACVLAQLDQPPAAPRFEKGSSIDAAGAEIFDRILYVPVMLNGQGPFTFVLDTGAGGISAVDYSVADSLRLRQTLITSGGGAGEETIDIYRADSAAVSLPGLGFDARSLASLPLHRMDPHWGKRKDGLIGGDLLSSVVTVIDYERERITFHDTSGYAYRGRAHRIPVQIFAGYIFVEADVLPYGEEKPIPGLFMLDTGVRITTFNAPFSKRHALAEQSPSTVQGVTGYGLGGVSRGIVGRVRGVRIGPFLIENPVVDFSTDERGVLADTSFSGIIGADFLSRFHVVLRYGRSLILLEKNRFFDDPFEFDMCGIRFEMLGERFDVLRVFSIFGGSPAAEAGMAVGDTILKIDGRDAGGFTREDLRDYLQREGKTVRFTIERGGTTKEVALRLRRLV